MVAASVAWEVSRNGPAPGATVSATSALSSPPKPGWLSRAVRRKCSVRDASMPTQAAVGSSSE
jgi:hypothetical protein